MAKAYQIHAPLDAMAIAAQAVDIREDDTFISDQGRPAILNLRGDASDKKFLNAVKKAVGVAPPTSPCSTAEGKTVKILWLAPDEWLIVSETEDGKALVEALHAAAKKLHVSAVDVSSNYAVISIGGPRATDVLAKMIPMDLHPNEIKAGDVRGTVASKTAIVLHKTNEAPTFHIYVRRSFSAYLWQYLQDAGKEFGLKIS